MFLGVGEPMTPLHQLITWYLLGQEVLSVLFCPLSVPGKVSAWLSVNFFSSLLAYINEILEQSRQPWIYCWPQQWESTADVLGEPHIWLHTLFLLPVGLTHDLEGFTFKAQYALAVSTDIADQSTQCDDAGMLTQKEPDWLTVSFNKERTCVTWKCVDSNLFVGPLKRTTFVRPNYLLCPH